MFISQRSKEPYPHAATTTGYRSRTSPLGETRQHNQPSHQAFAICSAQTETSEEKPGQTLKHICPACNTNVRLDVRLYGMNLWVIPWCRRGNWRQIQSGASFWLLWILRKDVNVTCVCLKTWKTFPNFFNTAVFSLPIQNKGLCKNMGWLGQGSSNEPPSILAFTANQESALVSKYKHTWCSLISLFSVKNDVINWKNGDQRCRLQSCPREIGCVLRGTSLSA